MGAVHCKLPKAGLGNRLFPLLKAYVFGSLNNLPVIVTNYHQLKIGPYLRGEKTKRNYNRYFTFQKSLAGEWLDTIRLTKFNTGTVVHEPRVEKVSSTTSGKLFRYQSMPHWTNYFEGLAENRDLVITLFNALLTTGVRQQTAAGRYPVIGVHIRMGDFRKLNADEDFGKVGAVRTPEEYFITVIEGIRKVHGTELPVSVFTDGFRNEFERLFTLKNITLVENNTDIVDLILLSKSKIIVTSAGSTFSYWAAFLSDADVIMHPDHIHTIKALPEARYQGTFDVTSALLVENIKRL